MKRDQYLFRRKGSANWHYRRRWPKEVAAVKGEAFLQRSLGVSDVDAARRLKVSLEAEFFSEVDRAKRSLEKAKPKKPSEPELMALAQQWFVRNFQNPGTYGKKPETQIEVSKHRAIVSNLEADIRTLKDCLGRGDYTSVRPLASGLMRQAGFSADLLDEGSLTRFYHSLLRVQVELHSMTYAQLTGDYSYYPSDDFVEAGLRFKEPDHQTLNQLIELFDGEKRSKWSPSAKRKYDSLFATLRDVLGGEVSLRTLGRDDMLRVRDVLKALPKNKNSRKETKGKTSQEAASIAEAMGLEPRSMKSINDELGSLSALFNYGKQVGYVDRVFTDGLKLDDPIPASKKGRPFTDDELRTIFSAPLFAPDSKEKQKDLARYWIPYILLYHGFRANEACQLNVDDIRTVDGIPSFVVGYNIFADDHGTDKHVKTHASNRTIPVHPKLIDMGFLEMVDRKKQASNQRIFPELKKDKDGYYSGPFSSWFSDFRKAQGVTQKGAKLHAFRHNYRNALRRGHVPTGLAEALGGWSSETGAAANYGDDTAYTLEQKLEGIGRVSYDCLE